MNEDEKVITKEDLNKQDNLEQEDLDYIEKEMEEMLKETIKQIEEEAENDEELKKEVDEIYSTDDIQERIKIWKKYHPDEQLQA